MVAVLQREAQQDEARDQEGRRDPEGPEAGFGLEAGGVPALVEGADEVVEVVARRFAEDGGEDGGEVEVACGRCVRLVMRLVEGEGDGENWEG